MSEWPPPALYPDDDPIEERRGLPKTRGRFCERCNGANCLTPTDDQGGGFFRQTAVAESYIVDVEAIGGNFQEAFLDLCEITRSFVSFPKMCKGCQRQQLTPEAISASRSGLARRAAGERGDGPDMGDPGYRGRMARLDAAHSYLESSRGEERTDWDPGSTFD